MQGTLPFTLLVLDLFSHYSHCHSGLLPVYSHSQSVSLPVYSHSIRLAAYLFSLSLSLAACLFSLSLRLAAYLFSLSLSFAACLFSHYQARCLSILTLSGSLSIYSHTHVTVYLFSHPMLLRHSCSLAHQCIRAHSRAHYLSILILATYISSPRYLVSTTRLATYLALVCCLAKARLTTNVLSCLSSICSCSYPSSHSDLLVILYLCTLRLAAIQSCTIRIAYLILH